MPIIHTSEFPHQPPPLSGETRCDDLGILTFTRWLHCVTLRVVALEFITYKSTKNIRTSYLASDAITATHSVITKGHQ